MMGGFHDGRGHPRVSRSPPVNLQIDLYSLSCAVIAQLAERLPDIPDGDLVRHAVRKIVGANFHSPRAGIARQIHELFA